MERRECTRLSSRRMGKWWWRTFPLVVFSSPSDSKLAEKLGGIEVRQTTWQTTDNNNRQQQQQQQQQATDNNRQQLTTTDNNNNNNNNNRQQTTTDNNWQQLTTTDNNRQQQTTTDNNRQQQTTTTTDNLTSFLSLTVIINWNQGFQFCHSGTCSEERVWRSCLVKILTLRHGS